MKELDELYNKMNKYYGYTDKELLPIILASALSVKLPGEPVWIFLVGPPASGKTEILRAIFGESNIVEFVSTLTPAAMVSGNQKQDTSLFNKIKDKCLIIKDFTTILEIRSIHKSEVLSMLRECYDGFVSKSFTWGTRSMVGTFSLISGVTNSIEASRDEMASLGERFLHLKWNSLTGSIHNNIDLVRKDISNTSTPLIASLCDAITHVNMSAIPQECKNMIKNISSSIVKVRTPVIRDSRTKEILVIPSYEGINRVMFQLTKILSIINYTGMGDCCNTLYRIFRDSMPTMRTKILYEIINGNNGWGGIQEKLNMSKPVISRIIHDMVLLEILEEEKIKTNKYYKVKDINVQNLLRKENV